MDNFIILRGRIELVRFLENESSMKYRSHLAYMIKGKVRDSMLNKDQCREYEHQARLWTEKTLAPLFNFFN